MQGSRETIARDRLRQETLLVLRYSKTVNDRTGLDNECGVVQVVVLVVLGGVVY